MKSIHTYHSPLWSHFWVISMVDSVKGEAGINQREWERGLRRRAWESEDLGAGLDATTA